MPESNDLVLNPHKSIFYRSVHFILRCLAWIMFRPTVVGKSNIPMKGPVLLAPIHRSNVDFVFSIFISPRKLFFMAKDGLFRFKPAGFLFYRLGVFPVDRNNADRESLRLAEQVLRRGEALILFPEGTRKDGDAVEPLHDGAMFIAARTRAKVVPIGIAGSDRAMGAGAKFPRFAKVHIVIGEPIDPPPMDGRVARSAVSQKTEELRSALEGVYAQARSMQKRA